jgi:hypothetical protein
VQVSRLISDGPPPQQATRIVFVLRGSGQSKSVDESNSGSGGEGGEDGKSADNKTPRTTTFTRTPSVSP